MRSIRFLVFASSLKVRGEAILLNTHESTVLRCVIQGIVDRNIDDRLMTWKTQASVGHRQAPARECAGPRSAIGEASLDRCAVRMRAGDESEEAKQSRQRVRPPRELACRYLPEFVQRHTGSGRPSTSRESRRFPGSVPDQANL
jgi:hypothetical protein